MLLFWLLRNEGLNGFEDLVIPLQRPREFPNPKLDLASLYSPLSDTRNLQGNVHVYLQIRKKLAGSPLSQRHWGAPAEACHASFNCCCSIAACCSRERRRIGSFRGIALWGLVNARDSRKLSGMNRCSAMYQIPWLRCLASWRSASVDCSTLALILLRPSRMASLMASRTAMVISA